MKGIRISLVVIVLLSFVKFAVANVTTVTYLIVNHSNASMTLVPGSASAHKAFLGSPPRRIPRGGQATIEVRNKGIVYPWAKKVTSLHVAYRESVGTIPCYFYGVVTQQFQATGQCAILSVCSKKYHFHIQEILGGDVSLRCNLIVTNS